MKLKYIATSLLCGTMFLSSCMDKFADINTDPSVIDNPDPRYLLTKEISSFRPGDYWGWFYDFSNMLQWGQVTVPGGSNSTRFNEQSDCSGGINIKEAYTYALQIEASVKELEKKDPVAAAAYNQILAISKVLVTYIGIHNTDMYGSMPYTEAYRARWGGSLTPNYDNQEKLFDVYLKDLTESVKALLDNNVVVDGQNVTLVTMGKQDLIYQGDVTKWAKLANSLRLKIAVRLYHVDKDKAFSIVKDVMASPAGIITDIEDNLIHNVGSTWYGPNEIPSPGYGNKTLVDFFVENKDPRVRFFFKKNDFNSKVIQAYFDAQNADVSQPNLPSYIADKVITEEKDGKKVFKGWKAPGEPWVRYHGLPITIAADKDPQWNEYFDPTNEIFKIKLNDVEGTYTPLSYLQMEMYKGNIKFVYPDAPGKVEEDIHPRTFYSLHFSASEVYLYLAEFKLLGADLPESAEAYYKKGVEASVRGWDDIAAKNNIHYYSRKYDSFEETINLKEGEVEALLQRDAYKLTGSKEEQLEKVYLQQRFNFIFMPNEMYVTMRRSGVPTKNSSILPLENFSKDGSNETLPRRFPYKDPSDSDQMKPIIMKALEEQGFTIGYSPSQLNTERVWYDKNAPQFGEGPKVK